jgi:hypothetical protein
MSDVRAIYLPGASALSVVLERVRAGLVAWGREWANEAGVAGLNVESGREMDLESDLEWTQEFDALAGAKGCVWVRRSAIDRSNFGRAVVGDRLMPHAACADEWVGALVERAWTARNGVLVEALVGKQEALNRRAAQRGSPRSGDSSSVAAPSSSCGSEGLARLASRVGSGAVTVSCESLGLHAIADAGVWSLVPPTERKSARLEAVVPLDRAAQRASVRIEVTLGSVDLAFPEVMDLRPGDVLRLSARLDQPLPVSCEGQPFAQALLGTAAGRKAIQITAERR